eukprot:8800432-Pyramimonas_sp.AAC.1
MDYQRKQARILQKRSRAWAPFARALSATGIRLANAGDIVTDPAAQVEALHDHWLPIFAHKQVDDQALKSYLSQFVPPTITTPKFVIPSAAVMRRVALRARASAPDPDRPPCRAWAETDGALEALEDVT